MFPEVPAEIQTLVLSPGLPPWDNVSQYVIPSLPIYLTSWSLVPSPFVIIQHSPGDGATFVGVGVGVDDGVDDGVGGGPEQTLPCIKSTPDKVNGVGLAQIELPSGTFSAK